MLERNGYELLSRVLSSQSLVSIRHELESAPAETYRERKNGTQFAIRNVHLELPGLRSHLKQGDLHLIATNVFEAEAKLVSATLFDKLPGANWFVPTHQDVFVPIIGKTDDSRWTNWSTKGGVQYVEPPLDVQRQLLAVRVHLDECPGKNGALEVVPASHHLRLKEEDLKLYEDDAFQLCPAEEGEILLMKPLLVHRSRTAKLPQRRRVLHVVYSSATLPAGLNWT